MNIIGESIKGASTYANYIIKKEMDKKESIYSPKGDFCSLEQKRSTSYHKIKHMYIMSECKLEYKDYKEINKLMIEEFKKEGNFDKLHTIGKWGRHKGLNWVKWFKLFIKSLANADYHNKYKMDEISNENYEKFMESTLFYDIQIVDDNKYKLSTMIDFIMYIVLTDKTTILRHLINNDLISWEDMKLYGLNNYKLYVTAQRGIFDLDRKQLFEPTGVNRISYSQGHIINYGNKETKAILITSKHFNENLRHCMLINASCKYDDNIGEFINKSILNMLPKEIILIIITYILEITALYKEQRSCKRCNINYTGTMGFDESYDYCNKCLLRLNV
jgi:hypothetical protein